MSLILTIISNSYILVYNIKEFKPIKWSLQTNNIIEDNS